MAKRVKPFLLVDYYFHSFYKIEWVERDNYIYGSHNGSDAFSSFSGLDSFGSPYGYHAPSFEYARGRLISSRSNEQKHDAPALSQLPDVIASIDNALKTDTTDAKTLQEILSKDYYINKNGTFYGKNDTHTNTLSEVQGHNYTYQDYVTRPVVEEILLKKPDVFNKWIVETNDAYKKSALLNSFQKIELDAKEAIKFVGFDLSNASFKGTKLAKSTFFSAKTNDVDFSKCDLSNTDITQEQLDHSKTYQGAKVPVYCWGYWDENTKKIMLTRFDNLKAYAEKHFDKKDEKYIRIMWLYEDYQPLLKEKGNPKSAQKLKMLTDLTSNETKRILGSHRDLGYLVKEIAAFILMLGVPYLISAAINKVRTGYFGLFTQPKSLAIVKELAGKIPHQPKPMQLIIK